MDLRTSKELVHIRDWLATAVQIVRLGKEAYLRDPVRLEAGDSVMMKIGEAAGRLARAGVEAPNGVRWEEAITNRNWLIHQYDQIDREVTWTTLSRDLPAWGRALAGSIADAVRTLAE